MPQASNERRVSLRRDLAAKLRARWRAFRAALGRRRAAAGAAATREPRAAGSVGLACYCFVAAFAGAWIVAGFGVAILVTAGLAFLGALLLGWT